MYNHPNIKGNNSIYYIFDNLSFFLGGAAPVYGVARGIRYLSKEFIKKYK